MRIFLVLLFISSIIGCSGGQSITGGVIAGPEVQKTSSINCPMRPVNAMPGSEFIKAIEILSFSEREPLILEEIKKGNIPEYFRNLSKIEIKGKDSLGIEHVCVIEAMPDYLAIGSDSDFVRLPMGPQTAQKIADNFGCILPTRKITNEIYKNAVIKLEPVTYYPVGHNNEMVTAFVRHNKEINEQIYASGKIKGCLIGGIKKDVVITNLLTSKPSNVAIYGWHKLNGLPIQPLYTGHINWYVDYSHGIRLISSKVLLDGKSTTVQKVLSDPVLYKILSDESGIMVQPYYTQ